MLFCRHASRQGVYPVRVYRVDYVKSLLEWRVEVVLAAAGLAYLGRTNTKLLKYRMYLELPRCTKYKCQSR